MSSANTPTQELVPIRDIKDGVLILKNGQLCMVLLASTINFSLKSLDEQEAVLRQFQSFLNTIDFSVQFYVQSRRLDIEPYLEQLREREPLQDNDLMKIQLKEYIGFVKTFTTEVDIMTKNFFIVVPYTSVNTNIASGLSSLLGKKAKNTTNESQFEEERTQLEQRVSVVSQGLSRIGVRTVPLGNDELVELFYHIFNPGDQSAAPTSL